MISNPKASDPTKICPECRMTFTCGQQEGACWCNIFPAIMPMDEQQGCLCPGCLKKMIKNKIEAFTVEPLTPQKMKRIRDLRLSDELIEDIDYYTDKQGIMVFTRWYHLRRGYCCKNGCRYCLYGAHK